MNVWLLFHVIGVVLAVGNILTAAFWKIRADQTENPAIIHQAVRTVMLADYVFTLPGILLIAASGSIMAGRGGLPLSGFNWLTLSLILFAASGILWAAVLIPLQRRMIRASAACLESGTISAAYRSASRSWAVCGTAATLLPIVVLYLMISKAF